MHDVAAAEGLRVFEGGAVDVAPAFEVDEIQHHRRRAEIDGEPRDAPAIAVNRRAVVEDLLPPPRDERVERPWRVPVGRGEDARATVQRRERHVPVGARDHRLAGQPVASAQEAFRLRPRVERVFAAGHLDHAFVAAAVAVAGGRHPGRECVGVVEQRQAGDERARRGRRGRSSPGRPPVPRRRRPRAGTGRG